MIEVKNLHKSYGQGQNKIEVLKGIDLSVKKGKLVSLLGPSGSGKSTLLNILGGIESIDQGEVIVFENNLAKMKKKDLELYRRKHVGFVFQFYNLIGNLTVRENILTGAYLSDNPLDIDLVSESLHIKDQLFKFPNQISGGQAQRTSIARAMIKRPDLLICDEPTGALDFENAKSVLDLIEFLNNEYDTTIILATHNTQIAKMCDLIVNLRDGRIKSVEENANKVAAKEVVW